MSSAVGREINLSCNREVCAHPDGSAANHTEKMTESVVLSLLPIVALYAASADVAACCCTCKTWKASLDTVAIWKHLSTRDFGGIPLPHTQYKTNCLYTLRMQRKEAAFVKNIDKLQYLHTLSGVSFHAKTASYDGMLVIYNRNMSGAIEVWNLDTLQCCYTFITNVQVQFSYTDVQFLGVMNHKIATANYDKASDSAHIHIWALKTGNPLYSLKVDTCGGIIDMTLMDNKIIVRFYSHPIRIWALNTGDDLHILSGEIPDCPQALSASGLTPTIVDETLVSATLRSIDVWDLKSDRLRCTLEFPHRRDIQSVLAVAHVTAKNNRLAARYTLTEIHEGGAINQSDYITIWALDTGTILHTTQRLSHADYCQNVLGFLHIEENMFLSPLLGNGIGQWDLNTGACTILGEHVVRLPSLAIVKNKVIATERGHSTQMIDLDSGAILSLSPGSVGDAEKHQHSNVWFTGGNTVITQSDVSIKVWGIKPPEQEPPKPEASERISQYVQKGITFLKHLWE